MLWSCEPGPIVASGRRSLLWLAGKGTTFVGAAWWHEVEMNEDNPNSWQWVVLMFLCSKSAQTLSPYVVTYARSFNSSGNSYCTYWKFLGNTLYLNKIRLCYSPYDWVIIHIIHHQECKLHIAVHFNYIPGKKWKSSLVRSEWKKKWRK